MKPITKLPSRPLRPPDLAVLEDEQIEVVPYGGVPAKNDMGIYALKLLVGETAHALGYDDQKAEWQHLAISDGTKLAAADRRLDAVLDDWVQDIYGDQFQVLKKT